MFVALALKFRNGKAVKMVKKEDGKGANYVEFTLLGMVGTQLVVSMAIGFGFGYWLDGLLGTRPLLMLVFGIFGVSAGFLNVYRTIKNKVRD